MPDIWIPRREIFCPLCDEPFKKMSMMYHGKPVTAYVCKKDNLITFPFDPMFNKWRDSDKIIPCPQCNTPMKWFGRMIDCYMKAECPECGLCIEKDSDMTINKNGAVEVEDMDQPEPEVIDIQIPVDKLEISQEKKDALKKQLREKRGKDGQ